MYLSSPSKLPHHKKHTLTKKRKKDEKNLIF